jgi:hypothetical protein
MEYEFSFGSFIVGLIILGLGVAFVRYYLWVADNFGKGAASYDRYRLYALITCGVGFLIMLSVHTLLLSLLVNTFFRR